MKNYEKDQFGNIVLPLVISNGLTGQEWIPILEKEGYKFAGIGATGTEGLSKKLFDNPVFESTRGISYRPIVVLSNNVNEDRYVPQIKQQYLEKGYKLAPIELLPLLCMQQFFKDFLVDINYRFVEIMHDPGDMSSWPMYCLAIAFDREDHSMEIKGTSATVSLCAYTDCMFIFVK